MEQTLGQYIRSIREARGMTQRQLSQAVGFRSLAHLSDIESGKRSPSRNTLPKFAEALGVTLLELSSRDIRIPLSAARDLFERRPEMISVFLKIVEMANDMDTKELLSRVTGNKLEPLTVPAPVPPEASLQAQTSSPASSRQKKAVSEESMKGEQPMLF